MGFVLIARYSLLPTLICKPFFEYFSHLICVSMQQLFMIKKVFCDCYPYLRSFRVRYRNILKRVGDMQQLCSKPFVVLKLLEYTLLRGSLFCIFVYSFFSIFSYVVWLFLFLLVSSNTSRATSLT